MSVAQIPALGIMCSHLVMTSELLTVITFHSLSFSIREQLLNLSYFLSTVLYYLSKIDKCQADDSLSKFIYKTSLSALAQ